LSFEVAIHIQDFASFKEKVTVGLCQLEYQDRVTVPSLSRMSSATAQSLPVRAVLAY